jgi:hypothetical protein
MMKNMFFTGGVLLISTLLFAQAPVPQIDVIGYTTPNPTVTGMAPLTVHVSGLNSVLGAGEKINAFYEWSFGDQTSTSVHNQMEGWNAAHVYNEPGTYAIDLNLMNNNGVSAVTSITVNVTPDSRTVYYLSENGVDTNDGLSAVAPIRTPGRANALLQNHSTLLIERGDTIDTENEQFLVDSLHHVIIGAYGTGVNPVLYGGATYYTGNPAHITIYKSQHILIEDITFSGPLEPGYGEPNGDPFKGIWAFTDDLSDLTVRQCHFDNISTSILTWEIAGPVNEGLYIVDNTTELVGKYLYYGNVRYATIYNNTCAGTTDGHCLRLYSGPYNVSHNSLWTDFAELENQEMLGVAPSFPLDLVVGSDFYVAHNELYQGMYVGYLTGSGITSVADVVLDGNRFSRRSHYVPSIELFPGDENIMIRNNVFEHYDSIHMQTAINFQELNMGIPGDTTPIANVQIVNNTFLNNTAYGTFINFLSNPRLGSQFVVANNLQIQPLFEGGALANWDPYMVTSSVPLTDIVFQNNLWQTPVTGDPFRIDGNPVTMSSWMSGNTGEGFFPFNASDWQYMLSNNFEPQVASTAVGYCPSYSGIFKDYHGNWRSSSGSWTSGAVELNHVTSISTNNNSTTFSLYPNPFKYNFTIESDIELVDASVSIYNLAGQEVYRTKVTGKQMVLSPTLSKGVYMVQIVHNKQVEIIKLIKS